MSDIFISYAKEDREWVVSLADALRQQGWTVWWDRSIPFGQSFQEVIERELNKAQCAIVVWSRHSVDSGWVSAEADEARNRNILVPVQIDDVSPPLVFRQLQTANLKDWNSDTSSPVFKKLIADIATLLGASVTQSRFSQPTSQEPELSEKKSHVWPWVAGLAGIFAAVAALLFSNPQEPTSVQAPVINEFRADNSHINSGDTLNLIWNTSHASTVEIREIGEVAHSGSSRVRPATTSIYTLIARNEQGQTTQNTIEISVDALEEKEEVDEKIPDPDPKTFVSMFDESIEEGRFDLAEKFLEKAINMAPDHPDVLRIKDRFAEEKQAKKLADEKSQLEQKRLKLEQAAAEKQEQLLAEQKKQAEAEHLKSEELQRQEQAQKLAEEQHRKEQEKRKKADQEKNRILEKQRLAEIAHRKKLEEENRIKKEEQLQQEKIAAENLRKEEIQRQQEIEKKKELAAATPASIAVKVDGVDIKFKRYGLLESSLKEAVVKQLRTAGFDVVSFAEAENKKDSVMMLLKFKYIERKYGGSELYTYSASTKIFSALSDSGEALWDQRVESMANTLELGKVNKDFARNVEKFIRDHPKKGLEFKK